MISRRKTSRAALSEGPLTLLHHLAGLYVDLAHVTVQGNQSSSMVEQHGVAVNPEVFCKDDFPVIRRFDWIVSTTDKSKPHVVLLIDRFSVVDVRTAGRPKKDSTSNCSAWRNAPFTGIDRAMRPRVLQSFHDSCAAGCC